ncbi:hypothetical protein [Roseospira visakhapatnamensis]|uniref:Mono/diheme cytochrome c family protein n=1 Tax=Roseospira visakhapatnamensis TaxID=390880 RepID=A0A7W6RF56_9PROT|nr:hypothetical protein [Roseospira visakhapatnamensis]MBB4267414.1 mono/diheme cytochrome c family protein [Roseospira visakhapatnamensis]
MIARAVIGLAVVGGIAVAAVLPALSGTVDEERTGASAERLIQVHCARCHPPLPDGGWTQMTLVRRDRAGWMAVMGRMVTDYQTAAGIEDRRRLADYLAEHWGVE